MLKFLASNIEQVDLALDHISQGDANNARFGLMLIDNVVEITLHQLAKDKQSEVRSWMYRDEPYEHTDALIAALGQHFEAKVKFARNVGKLEVEESETLRTFHSFRNEVYHVGVQHEAILPVISRFHLKVACEFLGRYSPSWISYSPGMTLPERARKYFKDQKSFTGAIEEYQDACAFLGNKLAFDSTEFAAVLSDHLDEVIEQQDIAIDMISTEGLRKSSRDEAVAETMAWKIAFTDKGKAFAQAHGWSAGSVFDFVKWIQANYPIPIKMDPIAAWQKRNVAIRREKNPHKALKKYRDFMTQTADIRAIFEEAHAQVEQHIDEQIDRMRGK
jgi:hypothetical protein